MAKTTPLYELHEQALVVEYLELLQQQGKIVVFSAVPNNMWTKSWSQKLKAKKEGVRPGVPDMIVVTPKKLFFIEMKRIKGGVVSKDQKRWIEAIDSVGIGVKVCRGSDEAKEFIDSQIINN